MYYLAIYPNLHVSLLAEKPETLTRGHEHFRPDSYPIATVFAETTKELTTAIQDTLRTIRRQREAMQNDKCTLIRKHGGRLLSERAVIFDGEQYEYAAFFDDDESADAFLEEIVAIKSDRHISETTKTLTVYFST